jgi:hypothetical protein
MPKAKVPFKRGDILTYHATRPDAKRQFRTDLEGSIIIVDECWVEFQDVSRDTPAINAIVGWVTGGEQWGVGRSPLYVDYCEKIGHCELPND